MTFIARVTPVDDDGALPFWFCVGRSTVRIIDGLFEVLRAAQQKDAAFRQFSWTQARSGLALPRKAHDLFYGNRSGGVLTIS